jgi:hypothetical protein
MIIMVLNTILLSCYTALGSPCNEFSKGACDMIPYALCDGTTYKCECTKGYQTKDEVFCEARKKRFCQYHCILKVLKI